MQPHQPPSDPSLAPHAVPAVQAPIVPSTVALNQEPLVGVTFQGIEGGRNAADLPPSLRSKNVTEWLERLVADARTPMIREVYRERIATLFDLTTEGPLRLPVSAVDAFMFRLPLGKQELLYADIVSAVKERSPYFEEYDRFEPLVAQGMGPSPGNLAVPLLRQSYMSGKFFDQHFNALATVVSKEDSLIPQALQVESRLVALLGVSSLFVAPLPVGIPLCLASFAFRRFRLDRSAESRMINGILSESLLASHFVASTDEPPLQAPDGLSGYAGAQATLLVSLRFLRLMGQTASNLEALIPNAQYDKHAGIFPEVQAKVDRYARRLGFAGDDMATLLTVTKDLQAIHRVESAILHHNGCIIAQRCLQKYMNG